MKDYDDKDLAMVGIVCLCVVGGVVLSFLNASAIVVGAIFTAGITTLGALATGRKKD